MGCCGSKSHPDFTVSVSVSLSEPTLPRCVSVVPPLFVISKYYYHLFSRCISGNDWTALRRLSLMHPGINIYSCYITNPHEEIPEYSPTILQKVFCNQTSEFGSVKTNMGFVVGLFENRYVSRDDPLVIYNLIKFCHSWREKEIATWMLKFMNLKSLKNVSFVCEDGTEETWRDIIPGEGTPRTPSDPGNPDSVYDAERHNVLDANLRRILLSPSTIEG